MHIPIKIQPFTAYNHCAENLGEAISALVNEPKTREIISADFPAVTELYRSPAIAARTVRRRQEAMLKNPGFGALAIILGKGDAAEVAGVATYRQMQLKRSIGRLVVEGPLFAAWKSQVSTHKNIGDQLLEALMGYMVQQPSLSGNAFTVVRPENARSLQVLEGHEYAFGGVDRVDAPRKWKIADGIDVPRQLFVARKSLEELRGDSYGKVPIF